MQRESDRFKVTFTIVALVFKGFLISSGIQSVWEAAERGYRQNLWRYLSYYNAEIFSY